MVSTDVPPKRTREVERFRAGSQLLPDLAVIVLDTDFTDPEGWRTSWLRLDMNHGKLLRIHPDASAVQEFVVTLWNHAEDVAVSSILAPCSR